MKPNTLVTLTVLVCIINGLFSPHLISVFLLWPIWFPTLVIPATGNFILFFCSLVISTATLLFSAAGAAIYERVRGLETSTAESMGVWLGGALLLSYPAFGRLLAFST